MTKASRRKLNELDFLQDDVGGWYFVSENGEPYSGVLFEMYSNGRMAYEGKYEDGYKMGYQTYWYENGQLKENTFSCWDNPHGPCKAWSETGDIVFEAEYNYGYKLWSNTYDNLGELVDKYQIDDHPQELIKLNKWISDLQERGIIWKWDKSLTSL